MSARPLLAGLPTFESVRRRAHALLSDASDELRSDTRDEPTMRQAKALRRAYAAITDAKAALDDAARWPDENAR